MDPGLTHLAADVHHDLGPGRAARRPGGPAASGGSVAEFSPTRFIGSRGPHHLRRSDRLGPADPEVLNGEDSGGDANNTVEGEHAPAFQATARLQPHRHPLPQREPRPRPPHGHPPRNRTAGRMALGIDSGIGLASIAIAMRRSVGRGMGTGIDGRIGIGIGIGIGVCIGEGADTGIGESAGIGAVRGALDLYLGFRARTALTRTRTRRLPHTGIQAPASSTAATIATPTDLPCPRHVPLQRGPFGEQRLRPATVLFRRGLAVTVSAPAAAR